MKKSDGKLLGVAVVLQIITLAISLVKVKVLTNILSVNDYGVYSVLINTMGFLIFAIFFGLDRYLIKENDEMYRNIILKTLYIILLVSVLIIGFGVGVLNIKIHNLTMLFIISTFLLGISQINRFYIYAKNNINKYNYLGFLMNNFWVILLLIFFIIIRPQYVSLGIIFIFMIIGSFISVIYSLSSIRLSIFKQKLNLEVLKNGLKYSIPLLPTIYSNFILRLADKYTLMFLSSSITLGTYNVALTIMNIILSFVTVAIEIYRPRIIQEKSNIIAKKYTTTSLLLVLLLCLPAISLVSFFGKEVIILFTSNQYLKASKIMWLTVILALIISVVSISVTISERDSKNKEVFKSYVYGTILNIILNILLVYLFEIYGAVLAGIISYLYIFYFVCRKNGFRKYIDFNKFMPVVNSNLIFFIIVGIIKLLNINFIVSIIILGILYSILILVFNRELIQEIFMKGDLSNNENMY